MRFLDRNGGDRLARYAIVPTRESDSFSAEQSLDDRDRFGEPLNASASPIEMQPRLLIFRSNAASAQAELQPPFSQKIDCRGLARDQDRMATIVVEHVGADAKMCGRLGGTDQCRHRRHKVCEMIGGGQRAVAEILDLASLLRPFNARLRVTNVHPEPKWLHFSTAPIPWRCGGSQDARGDNVICAVFSDSCQGLVLCAEH